MSKFIVHKTEQLPTEDLAKGRIDSSKFSVVYKILTLNQNILNPREILQVRD